MKRVGIVMLILFTSVIWAEWLQAQKVNPAAKANPRVPDISHMRTPRQSPYPFQRMGPPILPTGVSREVVWVDCPPEAQYFGAACGTLPVPLDRRHPQAEKIEIYFEVYFHWNPDAAESAILVNVGGPGVGTTALRLPILFLFGQNLDAHDILLIDDRGRGFSATIDCGELQHATAPFAQAEADCAAQLGDAASWYGTGDIAMDTDAVRAALGYDKVDYWGGSYGGEDVTAYATRFGDHLRSIVLDALRKPNHYP